MKRPLARAAAVMALVCSPLTAVASAGAPAYWVWPDMPLGERLRASQLYVLQAHIGHAEAGRGRSRGDELLVRRLGITPRRLEPGAQLHLVVRLVVSLDRVQPADLVVATALRRISEWEGAGQAVTGVQLDFDSPSGKLPQYARLLREVRRLLPERYRLSITGLGDWVASAREADLDQLYSAAADEIFFQLYQNTLPLPGSGEIVERLKRFRHPFRIGLLSSQQRRYAELARNPQYRGITIFR